MPPDNGSEFKNSCIFLGAFCNRCKFTTFCKRKGYREIGSYKTLRSVAPNRLVPSVRRISLSSPRNSGNRQTDRQTDRPSTVTLAHARRGLIIRYVQSEVLTSSITRKSQQSLGSRFLKVQSFFYIERIMRARN